MAHLMSEPVPKRASEVSPAGLEVQLQHGLLCHKSGAHEGAGWLSHASGGSLVLRIRREVRQQAADPSTHLQGCRSGGEAPLVAAQRVSLILVSTARSVLVELWTGVTGGSIARRASRPSRHCADRRTALDADALSGQLVWTAATLPAWSEAPSCQALSSAIKSTTRCAQEVAERLRGGAADLRKQARAQANFVQDLQALQVRPAKPGPDHHGPGSTACHSLSQPL